MKDGCALWHSTAASGRAYENRCRGKNKKCISVIYTVYMESGKKMLVYDREIACFSKTVAKKRNTAQRFLFRQMKQKSAGFSGFSNFLSLTWTE